MTRGERIAWIWVWCAAIAVAAAAATMGWRYSHLPRTYFNALICATSSTAAAEPACRDVIADQNASQEIRASALRRLAAFATSANKDEDAISHLTALIDSGSARTEDWNDRGVAYFRRREFDKAEADFQVIVRRASGQGVYWANLADARLELGKYAAAGDDYTTAMQQGYDPPDVRGNRGWARYQLGTLPEALADFDAAIAEDARHFDNLNERGLVHDALQNYEKAVADFDAALDLDANSPVVLTNRAIAHARLHNVEQVRRDLDRALSLDANYRPAHLEKAWLLIETGEPEGAMLELRIVESLGPLDLSTLEARCHAQFELGRWRAVIADADAALAMTDKDTWPHEWRARARYEVGELEGAIADAGIALARDPANMNLRGIRAYALQLTGRTSVALAEMDKAIGEGAGSAFAHEIRGYVRLYAGQVADALVDARQAVALAPQSEDSALVLAIVLLEGGSPEAALAECDRSLAIRESAAARRCRASAELDLGRPESALAEARRAEELGSNPASLHHLLGRIDLARGKATSAVSHFDQALRQGVYDSAAALMYRGDAERAKGDLAKARRNYEDASKADLGLHAKALAERLLAFPQ